MRHIPRELERQVLKAARSFPAVVLTGPRRAGKTWLLRRLFPDATHFLLEDPDIVARLRADPQGFLDSVKTPVILDEVQNVPEVFALVRSRIDRQPRRTSRWLLTGSQERAPRFPDIGGVQGRAYRNARDGRADATIARCGEQEASRGDCREHVPRSPGAKGQERDGGRGAVGPRPHVARLPG